MDATVPGADRLVFAERAHALLHLMPFPPSAPPALLEFERNVMAALDLSNSRAERIRGVQSVLEQLRKPRSGIPDASWLESDLLMGLGLNGLDSPVVTEAWVIARLRNRGLAITNGTNARQEERGLPWITKTVSSRVQVADPVEYQHLLDVLADAVARLQLASKDELQCLMPEELCAAIRCLQLHSLYCYPFDGHPGSADEWRLALFEANGVGLWLELWSLLQSSTQGGCAAKNGAFERYNEQALRQTLVRLRSLARSAAYSSEAQDDELCPINTPAAPLTESGLRWQCSRQPLLTVIRGEIPPATSSEDRGALERYAVLQRPLPVASLPEPVQIDEIAARLRSEFPWAVDAVAALFDDLLVRRLFGAVELGARPTLLVGLPGCGKSRLVRRLGEELGIPFLPIGMAGLNDSMPLLGTARGWSSAQASPIITLLANQRSASALILLDEVDKVIGATKNSVPPTVALLNLLEPEGAVRWYDTFLQTTCDLSRLLFWGTANTLAPIPKPLLSRFRVVHVPEPREEDFDSIAQGARRDLAAAWGLPRDTLPPVAISQSVLRPRNAREVQLVVERMLVQWAKKHCRPNCKH